MRIIKILATAIVTSTVCAPTFAQNVDLSGHWAPEPYGKIVPRARLVDAITEDVLAAQADYDAHAIRWCNAIGMPAFMEDTLDVRQSDRYIMILSEAFSFPRYIYLDLPPRDPLIVDLSSVGQSDGRWEDDTLVVESYGFAGFEHEQMEYPQEVRGILSIPGGGFRTPTSRLVERFRLTNDGDVLVVESTWADPNVFSEPHTYSRRYHRRESSYEPHRRLYCDPFDPDRAAFFDGESG